MKTRARAQALIQEMQQDAYNEGFQEGWKAAVKRMSDPGSRSSSGNPFTRGSGQAKVYEYMRANPGKRAQDIIASVDVSPKIVRNTCHRLKEKGRAINDEGWRVL